MPQNPVVSNATIGADISSRFWNAFEKSYKPAREKLSGIMSFETSDKATEAYAAYTNAAHPRRVDRNDTIHSKPFESVSWTTPNYDFKLRIEWHRNDRKDDRTKSLRGRADEGGKNFSIIPERLAFQLITGATDDNLLPALPTAPDGANLYATTAGGANRFGVSSGNLLTGTGVDTPGAIRTDAFSAIEQFGLMQDGEGQPVHDPSIIDQGIVIIFGTANLQMFNEAFRQAITSYTAVGAGNVAVSNIFQDSGIKLQLWHSQRITDNDWFTFLPGAAVKPLYHQEREGILESTADNGNSDSTRDSAVEYVQWEERDGAGINLPRATVKVNN